MRTNDLAMKGNRGQPWGPVELDKLHSLIDAGRSIPEIARILDRTQEGVRGRAAREGWFASRAPLKPSQNDEAAIKFVASEAEKASPAT